MTLTELEHQYPGLFEQPGCEGPAEAEIHADRVASKGGLTVRAGSWVGGNGNRHIEYCNRQGTVKLRVEIFADPNRRGSTTPWLFGFSAERVDACLTANSPHAVRVKPSSFERDATELVTHLRSLAVENGRVSGRLKKWNAAKGIGVVECFPGASVSVQLRDLPRGLRIGHNDLLSFTVEKSAMGQKAVNVRRCSGH
jgi:hypothetical protein